MLVITLGELATLQFNVTDSNISFVDVYALGDLPDDSRLSLTQEGDSLIYSFEWMISEITNVSLAFVAEDELEARSVLNVQVQICACLYGNCTTNGIIGMSTNTIVLNCECPEGTVSVYIYSY